MSSDSSIAKPLFYLAGPDVFLPDPVGHAIAKKAICAEFGLAGIFPLDNVIELPGKSPLEDANIIAKANRELMRRCDGAIAQATPFRGAGIDEGTAFEIGFLSALGKPVFTYTNDGLDFFSRAQEFAGPTTTLEAGEVDVDGLAIENFGLTHNLMIEHWVHASGGQPVRFRAEAGLARISALEGFRECCRQAASVFQTLASRER